MKVEEETFEEKLNAGMKVEEETFEEKFFLFVCERSEQIRIK